MQAFIYGEVSLEFFDSFCMSYHLGKNILATVTYYDVLNMPLSAFEIWRHLIRYDSASEERDTTYTLYEVITLLASETLRTKIEDQHGLYFLRGNNALVEQRIRSEKISVSKLKRMHRLARVLACVPYVRMLGVTGSLAMKNSAQKSDWDLFVVLRSGKMWMGRTVLTGILHCLGKRRHGNKVQDRACLNYFVTDDNLEIGTKDLFSSHEYRFFIPLLCFHLFQIFELKNRWIRMYRPNFMLTTVPHRWTIRENKQMRFVRMTVERLLDILDMEQWLALWQKKKIKRNPKTYLEDSFIEASDRALIFLPCPQGPRVFEKFKERMSM